MKRGITLIALVVTVVVLLILSGTILYAGKGIIKNVNLETLKTNMLLMQAKAKVEYEKLSFELSAEELANNLTGEKVTTGSEEANELQKAGVLSADIEKYYKWDTTILENQAIEVEDGEYYFINYDGDVEVIYPKGYNHTDGFVYYKLSELKELSTN